MKKGYCVTFESHDCLLTLTISWQADRYEHSLTCSDGSIDLTSHADSGVVTPVFTEIHIQDELVFLSGQEHGRHWSAGISMSQSSCSMPSVLTFDIACRMSVTASSRMGTVYRDPVGFKNPTFLPGNEASLHSNLICDEESSIEFFEGETAIVVKEEPADFPSTVQYSYGVMFGGYEPLGI